MVICPRRGPDGPGGRPQTILVRHVEHLLVDVFRAVPDCTLVSIPAGHDAHQSEPKAT